MATTEDVIHDGAKDPIVVAYEEKMAPEPIVRTDADAETETETGPQGIDFVTLGMFIIDEIEYEPPTPPVKDILGGAGTYSALGARLFSPPPSSGSVGWIVDKGSDFPPDLEAEIKSWGTSVLMRETPERLTTRGWNGYEGNKNRAFRYTTPKKRLTAEDLTPELLASRTFHLICSPARCRELVLDIKDKRADLPASICGKPDKPQNENDDAACNHLPKPIFIWEPVPDLCTPDELLNCTNVLPLVDIMSPNHAELAGFMGDDGLDPETGEISTRAIERACEQLLGSMPLQSFSIVVRAGEKGCYLARNGGRKRTHKSKSKKKGKKPSALLHGGLQPDTDMEALFAGLLQDAEGSIAREEIEVDPGVERWIPAFHTDIPVENANGNDAVKNTTDDKNGAKEPNIKKNKVVDPTGGGNTFLGGLAAALARGKGLEEAAAWGSVAASLAIEQVGMPKLGQDAEGRETWNGVRVDERFEEFKTRLAFSG